MYFWQGGFVILILELVVTVAIVNGIGFFGAALLWLGGALMGGMLLRSQGMSALAKAQKSYGAGALPGMTIFESLCLMAAGALLILPGFLSDLLAIALLVPAFRGLIRTKGGKIFNLKEPPLRDGDIIEGTYSRVAEDVEIIDYKPPQA